MSVLSVGDPAAPEEVPAAAWRQLVSEALARGERFLGLYALTLGGGPVVRALFSTSAGPRALSCQAPGGELPTIVDLVPAAGWDEREAHDLFGVRFVGHEPLRPLVAHPGDLAAWTVPVRGNDPYQVAVGPIHAGVIESGHFRFHVVGERILHVDLRLFYKHRGLERAAEGRAAGEAIVYAQRACAACAVTNAVAYAQACEAALGLWPTPGLADQRTALLEFERVWNHLNDLGAICAGIGFAAGGMAFAALKERAQRLNARLAGHRFLFGTIALGASGVSIDRVSAQIAREELAELRLETRRLWRELLFNPSAQDRLDGVGVLSAASAEQLGAVGPAARAAGLARDARTRAPRLSYASFLPAAPAQPAGDVAARVEMRALELEASFGLLDELLGRSLDGGVARPSGAAGPIGVAAVESPRGETVCAVELEDDRVVRLHLRSGSYATWPSVAQAAADSLLPDFPLINKSFELCYACSDR